jgi:hypothetical protein
MDILGDDAPVLKMVKYLSVEIRVMADNQSPMEKFPIELMGMAGQINSVSVICTDQINFGFGVIQIFPDSHFLHRHLGTIKAFEVDRDMVPRHGGS